MQHDVRAALRQEEEPPRFAQSLRVDALAIGHDVQVIVADDPMAKFSSPGQQIGLCPRDPGAVQDQRQTRIGPIGGLEIRICLNEHAAIHEGCAITSV